MASFYHLYRHLKTTKVATNKSLYNVSLMLFFVAIFDGILAFTLPFLILEHSFSEAQMGLIIGTSSMFGAFFDILLSRVLKNTNFRKIYLLMLCFCLLYPAVLLISNNFILFIFAMSVWGLYYDLMDFGNFDFINRMLEKQENASGSGIIGVFKNLGYFLAPIIAGFFVMGAVSKGVFAIAWFFFAIAFLLFVSLLFTSKSKAVSKEHSHKKLHFLLELGLWKKIGTQLLPVLIFVTLLCTFDAFFWTLGPLFSEELRVQHPLGALLMAAYLLPPLLTGWFIGPIAKKFGKKNAAFYTFLVGSIFLLLISLTKNAPLLICLVFASSFFVSFSFPSIQGAFSDYISETETVESEIEALVDFAVNMGYVIGPMLAGFIASIAGNLTAFSILGILGIFFTVVVIQLTPRHIRLKIH